MDERATIMTRIDPFDTPVHLARRMVDSGAVKGEPRSVFDPAMGSGNLLRAAYEKWRHAAAYYGCDIARSAVRFGRREHPEWFVGQCDFLSAGSRSRCGVVRACASAGVDLVLLNPPFSGRGGACRSVVIGDEVEQCSVALGFVATCLQFVARSGTMIALLPAGTLSSEKDEEAWELIERAAEVDIVESFAAGVFAGAHARTVLVRVSRTDKTDASAKSSSVRRFTENFRGRLDVMRGNVRMHEVAAYESSVGFPLIHTTGLRGYAMTGANGPSVNGHARLITGPAILLPRVGLPARDMVASLDKGTTIAPSDCVLVVYGDEDAVAEARKVLLSEWSSLIDLYGGSCAPYTTLRRLADWLVSRGFDVGGALCTSEREERS